MNFKELKLKYSQIDMAKDSEDTIIIKDFILKENGDICLSRAGFNAEREYLSVFAFLFKNKTPDEMDKFISLIGE